MILITGGAFQGKKAYAKERFGLSEQDFADGALCGEEKLYQARAVTDFHEYIRRAMKEGRDISGLAKSLAERNPKLIILVNELGCGVVPAEAFDREWRERVGRISCELAASSREVHRVICGIGTVIKND